MLGAIIGDIVGSVYEFNNYKAKDFEPFFHPRSFFTDDTVCTVAVADALVNGIDPAIALRTWGRRYEKNGGWGARFAEWLASDEGPYNSYGNGAGMRVSPAGLLAASIDDAIRLSDHVTGVTHNHPQGMRGAAATAVAIHLARTGMAASVIRAKIVARFGYGLSQSVDEIRSWYRYNERALDTVPQALTCALEATDYEDAIRNAISIGGDSDTVAAIAGGLAEALFGIPDKIANTAWQKLPVDMREVLTRLYQKAELHEVPRVLPRVSLVWGDILIQRDCDGIVNSANEHLRAGSGVCGAIHRAAGRELEKCSQALAPLALGEAIATPGFKLPQRMVIHTRGPKYHFDPQPSLHLARAIENTLLTADREKLVRLAVPAISTGVYAYPIVEAAEVMLDAAYRTLPRLNHLHEIRFVAFDKPMLEAFENANRRRKAS